MLLLLLLLLVCDDHGNNNIHSSWLEITVTRSRSVSFVIIMCGAQSRIDASSKHMRSAQRDCQATARALEPERTTDPKIR